MDGGGILNRDAGPRFGMEIIPHHPCYSSEQAPAAAAVVLVVDVFDDAGNLCKKVPVLSFSMNKQRCLLLFFFLFLLLSLGTLRF